MGGAGRSPRVSILVPALDEEAAIPPLVDNLRSLCRPPEFEVILIDGGSRDGTAGRFEGLTDRGGPWLSARVVRAERAGRAGQMNEGALRAQGDVLLFLHADTGLPREAIRMVADALRVPAVVGGGFRHRFTGGGLLLRVISLWATARSLLLGIHYGDQAMFVRRAVFEALGGFRDIPLFEDIELSRAMRLAGRVRTLPLPARTSSRRLRARGVMRTVVRFGWLKLRYRLGTDPALLRAGYPDVR
ncbi:MAG: TIGR04283 family arsenosugar biosynthesis glycosyltransferase [Candidatus Polarisedimenticolia bacterium]